MSILFWLKFESQIRRTRLAIKFLLITARAGRKVRLCEKLFDFFSWANNHPFDLKFVAFRPKLSGDPYVEFQEKTISGEFYGNFVQTRLYPLPKFMKFRPTFCNFYFGSVLR